MLKKYDMDEIIVKDSKTIGEIKNEFNSHFPHLKLEFYSGDHAIGEGSLNKEKIEDNLLLKDIRLNHSIGELSIHGNQKTSTLEENFKNTFGLYVQVFRKSGDTWIQTTSTDEWPLSKQEGIGKEFDN